MHYIPNTEIQCEEMLRLIGAKDIEELFSRIPKAIRLKRELDIPQKLSEEELLDFTKKLSDLNATTEKYISFLGAGAYNHFTPSVVGHLATRAEFYTSYTPYQPEISQGTLQAIFEYQTLMCQLTAMDVANASMYDGASAIAEAALMAHRVNGKKEIVISRAVHPDYRLTVRTYTESIGMKLVEIGVDSSGATDIYAARSALSGESCAIIVQSPNFFGVVENLGAFASLAHENNSLFIASFSEAISLGLLKPPGELGADIVAGEGQSFGNSISFGGPYFGIFATKDKYIRSMPGRLVGRTVDGKKRTGYVLTLATREQHIRRARATSNICTNHSLCALSAAIYLSALGKAGLRGVAELNLQKASYAKRRISRMRNFSLKFSGPTFNEFVIKAPALAAEIKKALLDQGVIAGLDLSIFYPELTNCLLVCVTEKNSLEQIEKLCKLLESKFAS